LVGSKLLFLAGSFPRWWPSTADLWLLLSAAHMRIPGGFLLAIAVGPLVARAIGVSYLRLCDHLVPAAGLCIVGIRLGCFLQGCCFGTPTDLPWSVRFAAASGPYWWQVKHGLIGPTASASLPVHPLQLYFAGAGLLISVGLLFYRRRQRYDGHVLLAFLVAYLWSTWLLELLRAVPHDLTRAVVLVAAIGATSVTAAVEWHRHRSAGRRVDRAHWAQARS
jgi:prolipoprotein diacylglyceryltransferase